MNRKEESGGTGERLFVVSNRLPVILEHLPEGGWDLQPGSGGLVTALEPVLRRSSGIWMGWTGVEEGEISDEEVRSILDGNSDRLGYRMRGISLDAEERDGFYLGFSNQVVWPLSHDFVTRCNFDPTFWKAYVAVNRKFAEAVALEAEEGDFLWIHDYHLIGVAEGLRAKGVRNSIGFFLHIPFPSPDLFLRLPWRFEILRSLLHYDLIGFQTLRDRDKFIRALRVLVPAVKVDDMSGTATVRVGSRHVRVGVFPISIDFEEFAGTAAGAPVEARMKELKAAHEVPSVTEPRPTKIILGVDRLDYTKGIPHKLRGFRQALRDYPDLHGTVTLIQLLIPSREDIGEYHDMKDEIDRLVGEITGEFSRPGWSPVHYQYGRWDRTELLAHYRAARVGLVTPLKDGMNLVAKEYCASNLEEDGVLVLSEHAGAGAQLQDDALLVNPYDVEELAEAIHRACTMERSERTARMSRMRERIRAEDIHWWVDSFLAASRGEEMYTEGGPPRYAPAPPDGFLEGL